MRQPRPRVARYSYYTKHQHHFQHSFQKQTICGSWLFRALGKAPFHNSCLAGFFRNICRIRFVCPKLLCLCSWSFAALSDLEVVLGHVSFSVETPAFLAISAVFVL